MTKTSYRSFAAAAGLAAAFMSAPAIAGSLSIAGPLAVAVSQKSGLPNADFAYDLHYARDLVAIVEGGFDLVGPAASNAFRGLYDLSDDFGGYGGYGNRNDSVERSLEAGTARTL